MSEPAKIQRSCGECTPFYSVFTFPGSGDVKSDVRSWLEMGSPSAVDFSDGTLTVNLPQNRVTQDMYIAALSFGICVGTLNGKDLSSVNEISSKPTWHPRFRL